MHMKPAEQITSLDDTLVVGIDVRVNTVRLAFLNPQAVDYPNTDDLHSCLGIRAFERYWEHRFPPECAALQPKLIAGFDVPNPPGLPLWLMERHVNLMDLHGHHLPPFLRRSADYEVPRRYRRAHALAQCAALKLTAHREITHLHATMNELNYHLRDVERALQRLKAAHALL